MPCPLPLRIACYVTVFHLTCACSSTLLSGAAADEPQPQPGDPVWSAGFAKVDITPTEPVRMAGYGNRDRPSEGVDSPLAVRCMALAHADSASEIDTANSDVSQTAGPAALLLVTIDTIGLPGSLSRDIYRRLADAHGVTRQRVVLSSTHTHCAPDLVSELSNIFSVPLSDDELEAGRRYKAQLVEAVVEAVGTALGNLQPAHLEHAVGSVDFAANRRVLSDGRWSGFGVQPDGPVDHQLPLVSVRAADGRLLGLVYNYACHATTLGGNHFRIGGDWPGYASLQLEQRHQGAIALTTIGCGADANPEPRGNLEDAERHGRAVADEVDRLLAAPLRPITAAVDAKFDHAALSFELPTIEEVRQRLQSDDPRVRNLAQQLDQTYREEGRLPATYPVPIQAWRFGEQLTMIFIGGEVVVDYALRLRRELDDDHLWVTAYAGDVLGYIASERMRREGGYEFDRSAVYYGLPGPWASGSEDHLVGQILDLLASDVPDSPVSANDAAGTIRLSSDAFEVELVAAEPLVQDPINLAFGADGKLWVVEMGDYPSGDRQGRIKYLEDTNGDGHYDAASVFLDELSFPSGVQPWRDGVLIAVAPEILFARDTSGDGRADQVEPLYSGFAITNPQHRVNGFTYGLDHSLHCGGGENAAPITSSNTGDQVDTSGHDLVVWPDSGGMGITNGRTQYIRARDDWGRWFGNNNSRPMYHFPVPAELLKRNSAVRYPSGAQQLFDPPVAPPVFPVTSSAVRFNDLYAANRFTSACSSIVGRCRDFDVDGQAVAFVCEPVHNLVHRAVLIPDGASYRAGRAEVEAESEFFASTDPWCRPVRCETGPDGALWVVDMYRQTIEHPQWIPEAWRQQLDLTAGSAQGRIYRVYPRGRRPSLPEAIPDAPQQWARQLDSPSGTMRDMLQRRLVERLLPAHPLDDDSSPEPLSKKTTDEVLAILDQWAASGRSPEARVHALAILELVDRLDDDQLAEALGDDHPGVRIAALRLCHRRLAQSPRLLAAVTPQAGHADAHVRLAAALALGQSADPEAATALARIAKGPQLDSWLATAVLSSSATHAGDVLSDLLQHLTAQPTDVSQTRLTLVSGLLDTAIAARQDVAAPLQATFASAADDQAAIDTRLSLAAGLARSLASVQQSGIDAESLIQPVYDQALQIIADVDQDPSRRVQALALLGKGLGQQQAELALLEQLLHPRQPIAVQRRGLSVIANLDQDGFASFVWQRWPSMTQSLRSDCVNQLLTRRAWIDELLEALESGQLGVGQLSASARQQLLQSGTRSMKVRAQRLIEAAGGSSVKRQLVDRYLDWFSKPEAASSTADGAALFKEHCAACHQSDAQGRTIGPSLENLSDRRDRALVEAILDPNLAVEPQYQSYLLITDEGELLVGVIESEVGETITLARADGTRLLVDRRRVAEIKNSGVSLMPEGLETQLNPEQLHAIVRYIQRPAS